MNGYRIIPSIFLLCLLAIPTQQSLAQKTADQDTDVVKLEEVIVVGSRVPTRSAHDSPVPVDVIEGKDMRNYGVRDMNSLLRATIPSYNVNQQPIGDAATLVRPANLRGLPPDSTLILVNGKRRHRGSVLTFLGGGISDGAHATDLAAFPAIALKRVEVLRDGAAAQYGSDAVAGVMNFELKDAPDSGTVEARWGKYYAGDGDTSSIAGNLGVPLPLPFIQSGFANFSFEYGARDWTDRSIQRDDAQGLIDNGNRHVVSSQYTRKPNAMVWGAPEVLYDYKLFGNFGMDLNSSTELYGWSNYSQRKIEGGFYYRNPNTRGGVFDGGEVDGDPAIKVANLDPAQGDCPVVPANAGADYASDIADLPSNCFMFNEKFPGGFTPFFGGTVRDWSVAGGIRGDLSSDNPWLDDWHYDFSAVLGQHSTDFFMRNTINPQLAAMRTNIPTEYNPGKYTETDHVFNLDLSRSLQTAMLPSPLNVGLGLEYRVEQFEVTAGGENSWYIDESPGGLAAQGFGIGSNGFAGFSPDIAGTNNRGSYAGYIDLETNLNKDLLVGVAGRYEKFETFGDTLNGKFNTRWQATSMMALRGSVSTGFRAPTVGQANIQNTTTAFVDGRLQNVGTYPVSHPLAALKGAQELKPEKSFNLSAGTVVDVSGLNVTVDYYRVQVRDRIARGAQIPLTQSDIDFAQSLGFTDIFRVAYYANAFDTTTQGFDIVATYPMQFAGGNTLWTFTGNYNRTEVTDINNPDAIDAKRITQLEKTLPLFRMTLTGDHRQGPWRFLGRVYMYDGFTEFTTDGGDNTRVDAGPQWLVDLETSYTMKNGLTVSAGAQNLFDSFPDRSNPGVSGTKYPEYAPYGFNGGYYYLRALYAF
ncbi:MAG: TonB-dependent receptor [Nitrospira sp. SB0666_bin_27]|nr:TonB-dependent receptor [Nitrospira sp. SB0666_bin_27]MYF25594.1 TonB-dependent receptor [Nitrospira sp. SB0678_bin_10]